MTRTVLFLAALAVLAACRADENDPRPIWVCSWGGANTLSQAIWRVQQTRSPEELRSFLRKFRLYTITDQDMVYAMRMDQLEAATKRHFQSLRAQVLPRRV